MLCSQHRGRDSSCRVAGMEPAVEKRGGVFSALGSMPAGSWWAIQGCKTVAMRFNHRPLLLDLGEKGVYPYYMLQSIDIISSAFCILNPKGSLSALVANLSVSDAFIASSKVVQITSSPSFHSRFHSPNI